VRQKIFKIVFRIIVCEGFINNTGYVPECRIVEDRVYRGVSPIKVTNQRGGFFTSSTVNRLTIRRIFIRRYQILFKTPTSARFSITRTQIAIGCSSSGSTDCKLMKAVSQTWMGESMKPRLNNLREDITQFDFYYISANLLIYDIILQSSKDLLFAVGSIGYDENAVNRQAS
jgi:hypothetical protein